MATMQHSLSTGVEICHGYVPGLVGLVGGLHGSYYAKAWGVGAPFEIQMAREFCDFVEHFNPQQDLLLGACLNGEPIGSISVLGQKPKPEGVQLRFFIVDPKYHGHGTGTALLNEALSWCRKQGHRKAFLWTVDHLPLSRHLYEKAGFEITERCTDDRYTAPLENLKMELTLG
jgi:GNAT superfamily N-acetyltransferase